MIEYSVQKRSNKTFEVLSHSENEKKSFCKCPTEGNAFLIKSLLTQYQKELLQ